MGVAVPKAGKRLSDHAGIRKKLVATLRRRCHNICDLSRYSNLNDRDYQLHGYAQLIINTRENSINMLGFSQDIEKLARAKSTLRKALSELSELSVGSERAINSLAPILEDEEPRLEMAIEFGPIIAWDEPEVLSLEYFEKRKHSLQSLHDGIEAVLRRKPAAVTQNRNYDAAAVAYACLQIWKDETGKKTTASSINPQNNANNPLNLFLSSVLEDLEIECTAK
ncbi:hypothetical protein D1821_03800 [Phaeobacter inhibens]|uniref:hypothetical protein n=1 Tax=Phaeobacter inhibens TaxID=221822 RepID=UPI000160FB22|nr:hypothetical protein [Phaeobacter inhibens]AXT41573.1 hypothetical protein D1821_03800 [Phaeobacter inhibens]